VVVHFTESAQKDYDWWKKNDPKKKERIMALLHDIQIRPFKGIGKPEPLKFDLQGYWSRRIDTVNRLVYRVEKKKNIVISCRFHYS
jgi:toxin YoeB